MNDRARKAIASRLEKCLTGVRGLDEITNGGIPKGRPTLICGGPGSGKTLMAMEFLARGAKDYGEPGVMMSFEETGDELAKNFASLGTDIKQLIADKLLAIDYVHVQRSEIEETGDYDLEGLFIRLESAINAVHAKRVVLDTIEVLFASIPNTVILRSELQRLFHWLKQKGVTAIVTGERGDGSLTRYGLEEYVADCVIFLDHRIEDQISTRRLRIVKYRGSAHGTDEYPFLIDEEGISVLPITSLGLQHAAPNERISSGIPGLDEMLSGKGYYRGSSILVSGTAGTGKTSVAANFIGAACRRGEKCIWFAFEEGEKQIVRNMRSIGIDLQPQIDRKLLRFVTQRPTLYGLEMHLVRIHKEIEQFQPSIVVFDPISNLITVGSIHQVRSMLTRLVDHMKASEITALLTDLGENTERTNEQISSLVDTWLLLRNVEQAGERDRGLYIIKSRGMAHSGRVAEFRLSDDGVFVMQPYAAGDGSLLTGRARRIQEAKDRNETMEAQFRKESALRRIARKQEVLRIKNAAAQARLDEEKEEIQKKDADEATVRFGVSGRGEQSEAPAGTTKRKSNKG